MNILFATSEAVPFAKTGGLADVGGALPAELSRLGEQVAVIMPLFRSARECQLPIEPTGIRFQIPIGTKTVRGSLLRSHLPGGDVPVYLVEQDDYFGRAGLYEEGGKEYNDNCERFVFFCRAVMEAIPELPLAVDILHCNDWPTGLLPAYLDIEYRGVPAYERIASLLTIHNLAYQGSFWHWDMLLTGLDWKYFNWQQMEFFGNLNLLKAGLVFADSINTVSPRYAQEIQSAPLGCGLEGVLHHRRKILSGIVNGVDYGVWNPESDRYLRKTYGPNNVAQGKAACKAALQQQMGLPQEAKTPVFGLIGRLADQKGWDLVAEVIRQWVETADAQWVILGTGEAKYHELLADLAKRHPRKVAVRLEFSDALAHEIIAGTDMLLMPSRFEPCGLTQLYSLKYGTIPVVRETGGLVDTIAPATAQSLAEATATGFTFRDATAPALSDVLERACNVYRSDPATWARLTASAMRQDWSWRRSAERYIQLYRETLARRKQTAPVAG